LAQQQHCGQLFYWHLGRTSVVNLQQWTNDLINFRHNAGANPVTTLERLRKLCSQLAACGDTLSDERQALALFSSMRDNHYRTLRDSIIAQPAGYTLQSVYEAMVRYWQAEQQSKKMGGNSDSALYAGGDSNSSGDNSGNNGNSGGNSSANSGNYRGHRKRNNRGNLGRAANGTGGGGAKSADGGNSGEDSSFLGSLT